MKLNVNLSDDEFCDGCPCLKITTESIDSLRHYRANCAHYTDYDNWMMGLRFVGGKSISRYKGSVIRPKRCIQDNKNVCA